MADDQIKMTIGEHFEELRKRLRRALLAVAIGAVACLLVRTQLFALLLWPLAVATAGKPQALVYLSPPQAFATLVKVCLIVGAIVVSPYSLYQMWMFIGAGLYDNERRATQKVFLPALGLFLLGVAFFFFVVSPMILRFFLVFAQENFPAAPTWGVDWFAQHLLRGKTAVVATQPAGAGMVLPMWTLKDYVEFVSLLSLVFGIGFQTPLVVTFLGRTGLVGVKTMRRSRPYVFLVILIVAACVTPPDIMSQLCLAVPMYLLFELGLLMVGRRRTA